MAAVVTLPASHAAGTHWNFHRVFSDTKTSHTFRLVADSRFRTGIHSIKSSCGCTTSSISLTLPASTSPRPYEFGTPIGVGAQIEIAVVLDTANKAGQYAGSLQVLGPDIVLQSLEIQGLIQPFFDIDPKIIDLGTVNAGVGKRSDAVRISSQVLRAFHLDVDAAFASEEIEVRLQPQGDPALDVASVWTLAVEIRPGGNPTPRFLTNVLLKPSRCEFNEDFAAMAQPPSAISMIVQARIVQDPYLEPDYLSFGVVARGETPTKRLQVRSHADMLKESAPPEVLIPATLDNEKMRLEVSFEWVPGMEPSYTLEVALHCSADAPPGAFRAEAEIRLPGLSEPIRVPVFGVIR